MVSFREKSAWVTLIALLLAFALYVFHVPSLVEPAPSVWVLHALLACTAAFVLLQIIAHVVLYLRYPRDARTPKDERERQIDLRATRIAAYVYATGSFTAVFVTVHLVRTSAASVGVAVLLAFVVAQIVNYAARVVMYRRDG